MYSVNLINEPFNVANLAHPMPHAVLRRTPAVHGSVILSNTTVTGSVSAAAVSRMIGFLATATKQVRGNQNVCIHIITDVSYVHSLLNYSNKVCSISSLSSNMEITKFLIHMY
jgi:hypothetical protein